MKYKLFRIIRKFLFLIDFFEWFKIYKLRKNKQIIYMNELSQYFQSSSVFTFATGGSLSNINGLEKLKNKNIFIMNAGIVHFYRLYGVMPNMWFIHNPDSIEITLREVEKYNLKNKLNFSNTFIFIPNNFSNSKHCQFSSKAFKKFRKSINNDAIFVLYNENYKTKLPSNIPENYLESIEPIEVISGSSVEAVFLPWLNFIGIKTIFFSGVDHMDTGHFWDRKEYYQDINGRALNFQPNELIFECGRVARAKCKEKGISVYRLEKTETILQDYEYIEFDKAYEMASEKILPKDLK
jgi:hypothetical protein